MNFISKILNVPEFTGHPRVPLKFMFVSSFLVVNISCANHEKDVRASNLEIGDNYKTDPSVEASSDARKKKRATSSWEVEVARCSFRDDASVTLIISVLRNANIEFTMAGTWGIGFFVSKSNSNRARDVLFEKVQDNRRIQLIKE